MALWSTPRPAPVAERGFTMPPAWQQALSGNFAEVNTSGMGAMQSVAVSSAVDLICSLVSELPVDVYRGTGQDRVQMKLPWNLEDPGGTDQGLEDWIYCLVQSWLYRGNAYGREMSWSTEGAARQVELFSPDDVTVHPDGDAYLGYRWYVAGAPVERPDLFVHRRVNPMPGRLLGASMIERHAWQTKASVAALLFGAQWFAEGAHPQGILVNDLGDVDQPTAEKARARWMASRKGNREPAVFGRGWKWQQVQVSANESQFLATMGWTEAQCARIFGPGVAEILGYESGGSMTYSNVTERRADLLVLALNRWIRRVERILTALLPQPQYVKLNRAALLESTTLARYEAHKLAGPWKAINEIRDDEDMPPVPWGDKPITATAAKAPAPDVQDEEDDTE